MALKITAECTQCGACEPACPNDAIFEGGVPWTIGKGTTVKGMYTLLDGTQVDAAKPQAPLSREEFYIVSSKCTECRGFHEQPQCASLCPVSCCVLDELHRESEEQLLAKKHRLHD